MTFRDISRKLLLSNFRRYVLCFSCNVFSVALFYCFAALLTDQTFQNGQIVDSMISSNVIAPSAFLAVFLFLFVPYSYRVFLKNRKQDYGIFMMLGMSQSEVLQNMLLENGLIAVFALAAGLLLGTLLSFVFYFFVQQVIGISALHWYFHMDSYQLTAELYGVTIVFTLIAEIIGFFRSQVIDWVKEKYRPERKETPTPFFFWIGVVLVLASLLTFLGKSGKEDALYLVSIAEMMVGFFLLFTFAGSLEPLLKKYLPNFRKRHLVEISYLKQHDRSQGRIAAAAAGLIGFSIFFVGISTELYPLLLKNAFTYSPYDLVYSQIFDENQVSNQEITNLLRQNGVSVTSEKQLDYLRNGAFNLLPVSEVNREFGCRYTVPAGEFLTLFPYDLKDGYGHDITPSNTVTFSAGSKKLLLHSTGSYVRILFNPNPTFAYRTLILNDADYHAIAAEGHEFWNGVFHMYSFKDWKSSGKGVAAVQSLLLQSNHVTPAEQHFYRATSRIESYNTAKQSAEFLIFLVFFLAILFCAAANLMVHFKIRAEAEEEQRMLVGLHRIGVTRTEMENILRHKNLVYTLPQVLAGILIGIYFNSVMNGNDDFAWESALISLGIGVAFFGLQCFISVKYSERELRYHGF